MKLTTKRFILRDFTDNDLPEFLAYHSDPRLRELYGPGDNTPEHAAELVQLFKAWAEEEPRQNYQLAIIQLDGPLVGCAGLRMKDAPAGEAELGIELAPEFWGQFGYAVEIMKCLVDYGFSNFDLAQIFGSTVSENTKIARLASAFGATAIERDTPAWMAARGWRQIEWQISRGTWSERPANGRL
ncbi:GNAT family N-acetyltransferase [Marinobacter xestospongiae]|uniref:GNAT family N-acetyltransferase n=1 Tax=Marinobacter xestospongiae TaxID=994319 RepID=A0ABU3W3I1_9GAMM|nr:GNAT family N-acetyltransferase [Marinobacter xestospongiae]MDV2081083.1 GNAT family N-acetyltransferase [Marinobacter xestospongiae]